MGHTAHRNFHTAFFPQISTAFYTKIRNSNHLQWICLSPIIVEISDFSFNMLCFARLARKPLCWGFQGGNFNLVSIITRCIFLKLHNYCRCCDLLCLKTIELMLIQVRFIKGDYRFVWLLSYDYAIVVYIAGNQRHPNLFWRKKKMVTTGRKSKVLFKRF